MGEGVLGFGEGGRGDSGPDSGSLWDSIASTTTSPGAGAGAGAWALERDSTSRATAAWLLPRGARMPPLTATRTDSQCLIFLKIGRDEATGCFSTLVEASCFPTLVEE